MVSRFRCVLIWAVVLPYLFFSCEKENEPYDVVVDFQDVVFPNGKYNDDAGEDGFFREGIVSFLNTQSEGGYRYGFVYSQMHDVTTFDYATNEYSVYVANDPQENKFMTGFVSFFDAPLIEIIFDNPVKDLSFDVANNTLSALAMKGEDPYLFARKFEEGDSFMLIIQAYDADGKKLGSEPKTIPLAQGNQIVDEWINVSVTASAVSKIEFSLSSTDTGDWGMNTPAYFCIDNIKARTVK